MREQTPTTQCERGAEDLMAYLYGESAADEARSFSAHLEECAACRAEMAAFGATREAMAAWRMEALGHVGASVQENNAPARTALAAVAPGTALRRPSAWAALRQFFALSPLWLRAAGATAALALCALAALAVVNAEVRWDDAGFAFQTGWQQKGVAPQETSPRARAYTEAEVASIIAARDQAQRQLNEAQGELAGLRQRANEQAAAPRAGDNDGLTPRVINTEVVSVSPQRTGARRRSGAQASATTRQPAPAVARDDYSVPRLYDLLGESD